MVYLLTFVACLFLSMLSTWYVRNFANVMGWKDIPRSERHTHTIPVPRLGGVAIYFSFMSVVILAMVMPRLGLAPALAPRAAFGLLGPALMVFLLGVCDDLCCLGAYWKFGVEILAAVWLYAGGYGIHNLALVRGGHVLGWVYCLPLTILWVLLITNAFNLIDGLDGLAAGSALFSTAIVLAMSLIVPNPLVTFLAIALAGGILGFLRYNFHPASIFLGDSGSLFIGFMLAALALAGSQKAPTIVAVAIPVISLGFPILDVVVAVARRFLANKPLFDGDRHHIHHKLLKRGLSQRDAVLLLYAVTAGFGFASLVMLEDRRATALVLAVIGIGIFLGIQQLRYQEFAEVLSVLQRAGRRRQILANHVAIRHSSELLQTCHDFGAIGKVVRDTLEPLGFDAIRCQKLGKNGYPPAALFPFRYGPEENLVFSWSEEEIGAPGWELRFELVTSSKAVWGYFSVIRARNKDPLALDINVLTDGFQTALSDALDRAARRLDARAGATAEQRDARSHTLAGDPITK